MPFNISLLGESLTANVVFIRSLFRGKTDFNLSNESGFALEKYVYRQTKDPRQEFVFFQPCNIVNGDDDYFEKQIFWLQSYSRHADVVIYSIAANEDEDKSSFISRAKQAIQRQKHYDRADTHAFRYCVIILSANLRVDKPEKVYEELTRFATDQGIESAFFTDTRYNNCHLLFDDFNSWLTEPSRISRVLGYLFEALLGLATSLIVDNPIASFLNLIQTTQWNNAANRIGSCIALIFIPFIFPIYYLVSIFILPLIYSNRSGHRGWLVGLETPYYTIKDSFTDNPGNITASFIIIGLMTAAILLTLGVFGSAVVGGIGLTALSVKGATLAAGFLGLGSGKIALSCMVGAATFVAGSVVYGVVYGAYLVIKAGFNLLYSFIQSPETNTTTPLSSQGPLLHYPPVRRTMQPTQGALSTPLARPSILVVSTGPRRHGAKSSFGRASYRPVLTSAQVAATLKQSLSSPSTPVFDPKALPKPLPSNAKSVPC